MRSPVEPKSFFGDTLARMLGWAVMNRTFSPQNQRDLMVMVHCIWLNECKCSLFVGLGWKPLVYPHLWGERGQLYSDPSRERQ